MSGPTSSPSVKSAILSRIASWVRNRFAESLAKEIISTNPMTQNKTPPKMKPADPPIKIPLVKRDYEFVPGEWYRTTGWVGLHLWTNEWLTLEDSLGTKRKFPKSSNRYASTKDFIGAPRKVDMPCVDVIKFETETQPGVSVELVCVIFLIEDKLYYACEGRNWYPPNRLSQTKPFRDKVYDSFRPSKCYPGFRRVWNKEGNPCKRSGMNVMMIGQPHNMHR